MTPIRTFPLVALLAAAGLAHSSPAAEPPLKEIRVPRVTPLHSRATPGTARDGEEEEWAWRHLALRLTQCPEIALWGGRRWSQTETVSSRAAGVWWSSSDTWSWSLLAERADFRLDEAGTNPVSAHLTQVSGRATARVGRRGRLHLGVSGHDGSAGNGIAGTIGGDWFTERGMAFRLEADYNAPWRENTPMVRAGGREDALSVGVYLPWTRTLSAYASTSAGRLRIDADGSAGGDDVGVRFQTTGRLDWTLLRGAQPALSQAFRNRTLTQPEDLATQFGLYAAWERTRVRPGAAFGAVPVLDDALPLQVGFVWSLRCNDHWGARLTGRLGQDAHRGIAWNRSYGLEARLQYAPTNRCRLVLDYSMSSESGSGLGDGRTDEAWLGLNINF